MYDVYKVRNDFPIFRRKIRGRDIIYLDNAATSQKPIQVIEAISRYYMNYNANIHRSAYSLARESTELYEKSHEVVADFIGSKPNEVIFVRNTTEAINLVAYSWGLWNLSEGDEVILTIMDHHSNIVPWQIICSLKKCKIKFIDITDEGLLKIDDLEKIITRRTKIVSIPHVSNVLGTINDALSVSKIVHDYGALLLVDGAQSVPHMPVNVKDLNVDFMAFSGHKMLGPTGIGVLYVNEDISDNLMPFLGGGDMIRNVECNVNSGICKILYKDPPTKYEAGTPNIAGAVGLMEAVKYLKKIGMDNIMLHEKRLTEYALDRLLEINNIEIYGPTDIKYRGGVISFNISHLDSHEVAILLDRYNIMVRSGLHCAQPLHMRLNIKSSVRASFYLYNTKEEVDRLIEILKILAG